MNATPAPDGSPLSRAASLISPPSVRALLDAWGVRPRRTWGQNFLIDGNIRRIVIEAAEVRSGNRVLEVGPGLGVLTEALLEAGARVTAVEKDPLLCRHLRARFGSADAFELIEGDALDQWRLWAGPVFDRLVSNLPYAVGSRVLVEAFLAERPPSRMVVTVQKEVAERLAAPEGSKDYGLLSVAARLRYAVRTVKRVGPRCFWPPPTIDSAVVALCLRDDAPDVEAVRRTHQLAKQAFAQRRKQLVAIFAPAGRDARAPVEQWLAQAGRHPHERPEVIDPDGWLRLATAMGERPRRSLR